MNKKLTFITILAALYILCISEAPVLLNKYTINQIWGETEDDDDGEGYGDGDGTED